MTIWQTLGIDPTDDLRAIRRGYAVQLKAIDMDAEPRRFTALREAYEAALSRVPELPKRFPIEDAIQATDLPQPSPPAVEGADRDAIERSVGRILSLLQSGEPIPSIESELADLTLGMIAEIDRDTIDRQAEAEEWIVATIAANLPRSDAMVHPAVASFRWQRRRHDQYRPDKAMVVVDRMRDLNFAQQQVLAEGGRHHLAWRTLQGPPDRGFFQRPDLAALAALGAFFRETGDMPNVVTVTFDETIVEQWHVQLRRYDLALDRRKNRPKPGWRRNVRLGMWGLVIVLVFINMLAFGVF